MDIKEISKQIYIKGYKTNKIIFKSKKYNKIKIKGEKNKELFYLKLIKKKFYMKNKIYQKWIYNEIEIGLNLNNKSKKFVRLIEYFYIKEFIVIVYEYIHNGNLNKFIENKNLTLENIIFLINEIFKCLKTLKKLGYNHLNLNENNIFINFNLIKLGGLKYYRKSSEHSIKDLEYLYLIKTSKFLNFFSPEFIVNKIIHKKSYFWNIGLLFFKFLKKEIPLKNKKFSELYNIYVNKYFNFDYKGINLILLKIIKNCLEFNYSQRINPEEFNIIINKLITKKCSINELSKKNEITFKSENRMSIISYKNLNENIKLNNSKTSKFNNKSLMKIITINNFIKKFKKNNKSYSFNKKRYNQNNLYREELFKIKIIKKNIVWNKIKKITKYK